MTSSRRRELLELLGNAERFAKEHPKVAEYFETAPYLSGSGSETQDAQFDLRFLHYATCNDDRGINPYWKVVSPLVNSRGGNLTIDAGSANGSPRLAFAQMILQEIYAYAVPSPMTLEWIKREVGNRKVIEIGAGRGYWANEMFKLGIKITAYDIKPPDQSLNESFSTSSSQTSVWHKVHTSSDQGEVFEDAKDCVLFLCWPPGWENDMASQALKKFEERGGTRLIYIGEPKGGKTADSEFFSILSAKWRLYSVDQKFVSWWNLDDQAQTWIRA